MKVGNSVVIQNKFAKACSVCQGRVGAFEGIAFLNGGKWETAHYHCREDLAQPIVYMLNAALEKELKEKQEKLSKAEKAKAEREALLAKLGIDFKTEIDSVYQQHAWNDYYEWSCPFTGDGTDEEFKMAVRSPAQSSYGKLRWSNGRSVVSIDRINKLIRMSESVSLCD